MTLETCQECSKKFRIWQTVEERLLQAIYGHYPLCEKCALEAEYPKCVTCSKVTTSGLAFNGKPYCPECLPYSE